MPSPLLSFLAAPFSLGLLMLLSSCAYTTVAIMPDEDGHVGKAVIADAAGGHASTIDTAWQGIKLSRNLAPKNVTCSDKAFHDVLEALPERTTSLTVHFQIDSPLPLPDATETLKKAVSLYHAGKLTRIMVIGHTDNSGDAAYNDRLSWERARAVASILHRDGVPQEHIRVEGFGYKVPLVPSAPGTHETRNRRVEIFLW